MQRFCVRCRQEIPALRVARGACFCSNECRRMDKLERLRTKRLTRCRLCGRTIRGPKSRGKHG
jgi:hypothetical protein